MTEQRVSIAASVLPPAVGACMRIASVPLYHRLDQLRRLEEGEEIVQPSVLTTW